MQLTNKSMQEFFKMINFRLISVPGDKLITKIAAYFSAWLIIVIVYGAIPFVSIPTLGHVVWASGFAESFVNAGWPAVKAVNFGLPVSAPMAFGAAGGFLESFFIWLFHLHAADAYAAMSVVWLGLALWGAIKLCQTLGASFSAGAFLSLIYLTLPMVWLQASLGILSFGFALLPLYVYMGFKVTYFIKIPEVHNFSIRDLAFPFAFLLVSFLSVFLEDYTFVMFYVAAGIIWLIAFLRKDVPRKALLLYSLPIVTLSGLLSYWSYTRYLGVTSFSPSSLNFFRGWGVDIIMLLVPSQGVSWLWDTLGVSQVRNTSQFFGDATVWMTTFALPLLVVGLLGYVLSKKNRFALPLLLIAIWGFYFSLGPSLKINSLRPSDQSSSVAKGAGLMYENQVVMPTGTAFFSEQVPGFKNMRASYRWSGMMFAGLFGLSVLLYGALSLRGYRSLAIVLILFLIMSNMPELPRRLLASVATRKAFFQIDSDLVASMNKGIGKGKVVIFVPPGNDFIVNYLASSGKYFAYNIGGDKNVEMSRANWPKEFKDFFLRDKGKCFGQKVSRVLQLGLVDNVVFPYFDTLVAAHGWPVSNSEIEAGRLSFSSDLQFFKNDTQFKIYKNKYYAVISLASPGKKSKFPVEINRPVNISNLECDENNFVFGEGWYAKETNHVWSSSKAEIMFSLPDACLQKTDCNLELYFNAYNALPSAPKLVQVEINGKPSKSAVIISGARIKWILPLKGVNQDELKISILVPDAISPLKVGQSADSRVLGISLYQIEVSGPVLK